MRTTVNLDEDVLLAVRERARRERRSAGEVLSEAARRGLAGPAPGDAIEEFYGFRPLPPRGGLVSNAIVDQLREDDAQ